ncbi:sulfur carrier protein ThiS [Alkanindiges hydrocarboniclasticus]|uniref:sulfur carrier protein ThiS n=1 Tax=Alkanindiges hydrocarboniclasticus TaxID=1907941 RepID=UPI0018E9C4C3|nr:sulfur carrier protein ThiS [Alkanindiges hydrocarboniclasticus]
MNDAIHVHINGEARQVKSVILAALIAELGLQDKRLAVELDEMLVPKSKHAETVLHDGAKIEIIQAVGGG